MNNDFAEFAQGFRERTAKRLLEFEKTLAKAQDELEKSADKAMQEARREKGQVGRRQAAAPRPRYGAAPGAFTKRVGAGAISAAAGLKP